MHHILRLLLSLSAAAAGAGAVTFAQAAEVKAPSITVLAVQKRELVETIVATGTLVARDEVRIMAQVDGLAVTDILAEAGDHVAKNQILARLDATTLRAQLAQNAANLARAEAANSEAQKSLARTQTLRQSGFSTQEQLDQRISAAHIAQADAEAVRAQRSELETRLSRAEIKAPVAGIINRRTARLGMIAGANDPLFVMIAGGEVEMEAEIADTQYKRIAVGQPAKIFPASSEQPVAGVVRLVAPQIDEQTRLGHIRISLVDEKPFPVGGYARAVIETARHNNLAVPLSALAYTKNGPSVQLVLGDAVKTQPVALGIIADGYAEVMQGLKEGDQIVARAGTFLRDGDKIAPVMATE